MEDREIIALYFARDEEAIRETDRRYGAGLLSLAVRVLESAEEGEEVRSDTYLKAWNAIPPLVPVHFYAWLAKVCRRLALSRLDWLWARKRHALTEQLSSELEQCIPDRKSGSLMEEAELRLILEDFIRSLPPDKRRIFISRYLYMETVEEIADRYGYSQGKVKTDLFRLRKRLREELM